MSAYCDLALSTSPFIFSGQYVDRDSRNSVFLLALCESWKPGTVDADILSNVFQKNFQKKIGLQQMSRFE